MRTTTTPLLIAALIGLTACGNGGDAPVLSSFGSTDPAASRSGIDFADGTQSLSDLEGQTHTVQVVRTVTDEITGEVRQIVSDEEITISGGAGTNDVNFTITLDGETLEFVDSTGERADGSLIRGFDLRAIEADDPQFVSIFRLINSTNFPGNREDEVTIAHFATGFETSPDALALTTGSATYEGFVEGFSGKGNLDGTFLLNANFANSTIDGQVDIAQFGSSVGDGAVRLDLAPTVITGNGFTGDLTVAECSFSACTSDSEIGGAFYGPNAEEVAGVVLVDVAVTDATGQTDQVDGTAGFGGGQVPN